MRSTRMTLDEFMQSNLHNSYIYEDGLEIYVRKSSHIRHNAEHADVELANIQANIPGKRSFTDFLDKYEPKYIFYIENVLNSRFEEYLERRGYLRIDTIADFPHPPSFVGKKRDQ